MASRDDNLLQRLLAIFKVEAQEHIEALASGLIDLEKCPAGETQNRLLDTIFRHAHSLKGAARAVNVTDIESVCQSLEDLFAALKRHELTPTPELFDLLHQISKALGELLGLVDQAASPATKPKVNDLIQAMRGAVVGRLPMKPKPASEKQAEPPPPLASIPAPPPPVSVSPAPVETEPASLEEKSSALNTVRVATAKLDAVLLQAEELLFAKQTVGQQVKRLARVGSGSTRWRKNWTKLRPDVRLIQKSLEGDAGRSHRVVPGAPLERVVEFLETSKNFIESLEADLHELTDVAARDHRSVGAMVDNLLDEMKKIVMQPFTTLLDLCPRLVRELSREQGKEVKLFIQGGDIEIDRRILEEMKDPLIHLVRNCVDHGLETPHDRIRNGKKVQGLITINVTVLHGNQVELLIADDGRGVNVAKVKEAAKKLRLLPTEGTKVWEEKEILPLIFQSGVSTSPIITDLSGRGLGLAIVKEKVEKLNGTLSIETEPGQGTRFRMILPLTLARFHGVIVRTQEQLFVLPTCNIERVCRVRRTEVKTVENRETITVNGHVLSLARLDKTLNLVIKPNASDSDFWSTIILTAGNQRIAFVIDEVLNEQEVLVKTLGKQLIRVRNIAGATVLGNGKVVPILNVPDLIDSAIRLSDAGGLTPASAGVVPEVRGRSVLVAEDSITSRTLLKNILETAGYQVETSVDGIDALTKLRTKQFDLVVSDVDMPRMNGFGLTAKIRADPKLAEIPVILVTSLDSREDREHGIDVGATAYIVKSSFDQSNLLDVIRRSI